MAKKVHSVSVKGLLEVDFNNGIGVITEVTKDNEIPYNFFDIINEFNGKSVSIVIKEEQDIEPIKE